MSGMYLLERLRKNAKEREELLVEIENQLPDGYRIVREDVVNVDVRDFHDTLPDPEPDPTDWHNWQINDLVFCTETCDDGLYRKGEHYRVVGIDPKDRYLPVKLGNKSDDATWSCGVRNGCFTKV